MRKIFTLFGLLLLFTGILKSQVYIDYSNPRKYTIQDIKVSGIRFLSKNALILISGLKIGQEVTIPGEDISKAIDKLWEQDLFSDVKITITKIEDEKIWLDIYLQEQPRLNKVTYYGVKRSQQKDLKEKLGLSIGKKITDNMLSNTKMLIKEFFAEKGFPFVDVTFKLVDDTLLQNTVNLSISIDKKHKVKIDNIIIKGNKNFSKSKIKRTLKETKQKQFFRFWKASKYIEEKYIEDKKKLIEKYNKEGYRDAKIITDSVYSVDNKYLKIFMHISEGKKYYLRNIEWVGNTKYTTAQLSKILDVNSGDIYDQQHLNDRLYTDENAVGNLYYDAGYLFFQATPQELVIVNDSVDIRIFIIEGPQATIKNVIIGGNTRSNEYVIRRELRTLPGNLFSKTDLIRSARELAALGNFDPEQLTPRPIPNPNDGTVDIEYKVVERPSDVFELSGGWSYYGFTAQVGVTFNNFSMQNFFKFKEWDPLPMGDAQKLSLRARVTGARYQMYSISFVNPWFGGKKPNSFSISVYYNRMVNTDYFGKIIGGQSFNVIGASVGLGRKLKWPDDYFVLSNSLGYDRYKINGYQQYINADDGSYNIISLTNVLSRNSTDNPIYTRRGSDLSILLKLTPPYSFLTNNRSWKYGNDATMYKWAELYKLNIKASWYNRIFKDLVLLTRFEYGSLGFYNKKLGYTPFEGFDVGGSGMSYYTFGVDYIALRGYKDHSIANAGEKPARIYSKYTAELRYPVILKEMANVYVLGFLEAGNAWDRFNEYSPFDLKRSAGIGARLFVPMLGQMGVDFGYGFDKINGASDAAGWNFHFTFGQQF